MRGSWKRSGLVGFFVSIGPGREQDARHDPKSFRCYVAYVANGSAWKLDLRTRRRRLDEFGISRLEYANMLALPESRC